MPTKEKDRVRIQDLLLRNFKNSGSFAKKLTIILLLGTYHLFPVRKAVETCPWVFALSALVLHYKLYYSHASYGAQQFSPAAKPRDQSSDIKSESNNRVPQLIFENHHVNHKSGSLLRP